MSKSVLYIVSGRGFYKKNLMRKIDEVIKVWEIRTADFKYILGGELDKGNANQSIERYVSQKFYDNRLRKNSITLPIINSLSELKDIIHDIRLYISLKNEKDRDLIIERSSRLHIAGLVYAKINNIKYCLEWKDNLLNYNFSAFKWLGNIYEKIKIKKADYIIVESQVLKELIIKQYNVNEDKIFVSVNAVCADDFKKVPRYKNNNRLIIGYMGSYAYYHNPQLLIHCINRILILRPELVDKIELKMVGNGLYYQECLDLTELFNLSTIVKFYPGVEKEEVPNVLNDMDIGVLPGSTDIICPIKIFEYMASGLITVAPDYDCNKEIVINKVNGFLFSPNDIDSLSSTLIDIIDNIDKYRTIGNVGEKDVLNKYSWNNTWGATLDKILKSNRYEK